MLGIHLGAPMLVAFDALERRQWRGRYVALSASHFAMMAISNREDGAVKSSRHDLSGRVAESASFFLSPVVRHAAVRVLMAISALTGTDRCGIRSVALGASHPTMLRLQREGCAVMVEMFEAPMVFPMAIGA